MLTQMDVNEAAVRMLDNFLLDGAPILCRRFGKGHINDTYLVADDTARLYILQKINKNVFREPLTVMRNIMAITSYLNLLSVAPRSVPELLPSLGRELWHVDENGDYWRVYSFIADSICYQRTDDEALFRESAVAFGAFQRNLMGFPVETLGVTIPRFHDTPNRYAALHDAIKADTVRRVREVPEEIAFAMGREESAGVLMARQAEGALPARVTHNDTKLNNVLFDRWTKKSICVIDFDTVMPGLSALDFGDSIRFGASTADEDEPDVSKVSFSLRLFRAYAEGFLSACGVCLTANEIDSLCDGARVITLENGVRFLTDYLSGDTYYKIEREKHNLDRCRTHFKLVRDMESSWDAMQAVIRGVAYAK